MTTGAFDYRDEFLSSGAADRLFNRVWKDLQWRQEPIVLFGRRVPQPRLTAWVGDPGACYHYSGLALEPASWTRDLASLRARLQDSLGQPFNSVLANAYRDGRDSMGWHADDEPELGSQPVIASVSLGASRRFLVRSRQGGKAQVLHLKHGSLLVMQRDAQVNYRHALPKTARPVGLRINLTFRNVRQA